MEQHRDRLQSYNKNIYKFFKHFALKTSALTAPPDAPAGSLERSTCRDNSTFSTCSTCRREPTLAVGAKGRSGMQGAA